MTRNAAMLSFIFCVTSSYAWGAGHARENSVLPPFSFERSMVIPDVPTSPYSDVISLDVKGGRIFATPQAAKAVAVFDLKDGRLLKMIPGFSKLHGVIFDDANNRLYVSDGTTGEVKVFSGIDYSLIATIPLRIGADSLTYDPKTGFIYAANGGEDAEMDHSLISVIDTRNMTKVADINVAASGLEGIVINSRTGILYASLVNDRSVAVIDTVKRRQSQIWKLPVGDHSPFALAVDDASNRLYVTSRENFTSRERPVGTLFIINTETGKAIGALGIGGWADQVHIDNKRKRIYVVSGAGWINTFHIDGNDKYTKLPDVEIPLMSKHSLFSEQLNRLFIDTPKMASTQAQLLEFKPVP